MDIVRIANHKLMEQNFSTVTDSTLPICVGLSDHLKVHYQLCIMFIQTHQKIVYLKEIFQNVHLSS